MSGSYRRCVKVGDTYPPVTFSTPEAPLDLTGVKVTQSVDGGPYEEVKPIDPGGGVVPLPQFTELGTHTVGYEIHWGDAIESVYGEVEVVDE